MLAEERSTAQWRCGRRPASQAGQKIAQEQEQQLCLWSVSVQKTRHRARPEAGTEQNSRPQRHTLRPALPAAPRHAQVRSGNHTGTKTNQNRTRPGQEPCQQGRLTAQLHPEHGTRQPTTPRHSTPGGQNRTGKTPLLTSADPIRDRPGPAAAGPRPQGLATHERVASRGQAPAPRPPRPRVHQAWCRSLALHSESGCSSPARQPQHCLRLSSRAPGGSQRRHRRRRTGGRAPQVPGVARPSAR